MKEDETEGLEFVPSDSFYCLTDIMDIAKREANRVSTNDPR
jgi:hypothetical protein